MYNFENEPIPVFLPVLEGVQLKPWFTTSLLDKGLELIRDNKIDGFHCIRNAAGALVEQGATVTLVFEKSATLHQGFVIRNSHCGLCRLKSNEKWCEHLAALAILSLIVPTEQAKAVPIPLAFAKSHWLRIGHFLYDWLSRAQMTVHRTEEEGFCRWESAPDAGRTLVTIPDSWVRSGRTSVPGQVSRNRDGKTG
jgi:hypothetical protein